MTHSNSFQCLSIKWSATILTTGIFLFSMATCPAGDSTTESAKPDRWPGYLGAGTTHIDPGSLPVQWSPTENMAWQTDLAGKGQSSPVIWDETVFVTSIDGMMKNDCHVTMVSLRDGTVLWDYHQPSAQPVRVNYFQSRSAPTPAVDADRVYAFFETGNLLALTHSGEKVWSRALTDDYGEFEVRIGLASSLAQTEKYLFVLIDHEGPSYLLAVDKTTGETKWKTERFSRSSYASPTLLQIEGQPQVVCSSSGSVDGYDPQTGELLWTYEEVGGNRSTSPMPLGDGRFLVSASPGMHDKRLAEARESNGVMQVELVDGEYQMKWLWKAEKAMPSFGSPIVHRGLAYWMTKAGVLYCFDATSGELVYRERAGQSCWATPLAMDDHIYFFGKDGKTTVIAAGTTFEILAQNEIFPGAAEREERRAEARREFENRSRSERGASNGSEKKQQESQSNSKKEQGGSNTDKQAEPSATATASPESNRTSNSRGGRPSSRNGKIFADQVQYGYAAVNGSLVIRTGGKLHCIRRGDLRPAATVNSTQNSSEGVNK